MNEYITFHKTVRGDSHIRKGTPCEDSSVSYSEENGLYHMAVIADGHGDPSCFRSQIGSQTAVQVAADCLKTFAEAVLESSDSRNSILESLSRPKSSSQVLRQLTDTIISRWATGVLADLDENPMTEEELKSSGKRAEEYQNGKNLEHIYGTTLMAALLVRGKLIMLHQGDGRCDVFYEDGTVDQPIPWDERCVGNVTTSMCQEDAPESIRTCVLDLQERPVIACYLGSDGVEDSFCDMEGTHMFYRKLSHQLVQRGKADFTDYLEEELPALSKCGSADDTTVAGIVCMEGLARHAEAFGRAEEIYSLTQRRDELRDRLMQMPHKHGILRRYRDEALQKLEESKQQKQEQEKRLEDLRSEKTTLELEFETAMEQWDAELRCEEEQDESVLERVFDWFKIKLFTTSEKFYPRCQKMKSAMLTKEREINSLEQLLAKMEEDCAKYEADYLSRKREFEEYDEKYQSIQNRLDALNQMLKELENGDPSSAEETENGVEDDG